MPLNSSRLAHVSPPCLNTEAAVIQRGQGSARVLVARSPEAIGVCVLGTELGALHLSPSQRPFFKLRFENCLTKLLRALLSCCCRP